MQGALTKNIAGIERKKIRKYKATKVTIILFTVEPAVSSLVYHICKQCHISVHVSSAKFSE